MQASSGAESEEDAKPVNPGRGRAGMESEAGMIGQKGGWGYNGFMRFLAGHP